MDDEGIGDVLDVIPMPISEGLEALDFVWHKNGDGRHVGVGGHPQSQIRAGTWWVIVDFEQIHQFVSSSALFQLMRFQPQPQRQAFEQLVHNPM